MFEDIQKHRQAVRENIEKSLQIGYTESEDFEKAHKVGDIHPNGKWVWTQLPSGKFDWRVIKNKQSQSTATSQQKATQSQKTNIVLTNEDYDKKFFTQKGSFQRQTPFNHNGKIYILKIAGKQPDGSYLISVHNNEGKMLKGNSNVSISVRNAFIEELKKEKLMATQSQKKTPKNRVPGGKRINYDDDIVEVYDNKGKKVYTGILDDTPYKYEDYRWNDKDKNYDLPHGYKMVGK